MLLQRGAALIIEVIESTNSQHSHPRERTLYLCPTPLLLLVYYEKWLLSNSLIEVFLYWPAHGWKDTKVLHSWPILLFILSAKVVFYTCACLLYYYHPPLTLLCIQRYWLLIGLIHLLTNAFILHIARCWQPLVSLKLTPHSYSLLCHQWHTHTNTVSFFSLSLKFSQTFLVFAILPPSFSPPPSSLFSVLWSVTVWI